MDKKKLISVLALIMAGVMILTLAMSLITTLVNAASSSEIRDQIADLEEEKSIVDAELKELEGITLSGYRLHSSSISLQESSSISMTSSFTAPV